MLGLTGIFFAVLLLAQNGDNGEWLEGYTFQRELNECVVMALAEKTKNGGLGMDRTGHGSEADRVLEECRKELGETRER